MLSSSLNISTLWNERTIATDPSYTSMNAARLQQVLRTVIELEERLTRLERQVGMLEGEPVGSAAGTKRPQLTLVKGGNRG
jgi:hypothetical protein